MMAVAAGNVAAQVAGSTTIGVSPDEVKTLARGYGERPAGHSRQARV